jgi:hypothetical protein
VLVSIGCSVVFNEAPLARTLERYPAGRRCRGRAGQHVPLSEEIEHGAQRLAVRVLVPAKRIVVQPSRFGANLFKLSAAPGIGARSADAIRLARGVSE